LKTFASKVIDFYSTLEFNHQLPKSVEVMNPYRGSASTVFKKFYQHFYNDNNRRLFIFGINPGRFGAGVTGIPFTDPIRLAEVCGIVNDFKRLPELSSVFVYAFIEQYGGIKKFCTDFYITAVSPLGFVKDKKNMNYYDDKKLEAGLHDFIVSCIRKQIAFGAVKSAAICLGEGQNFRYLSKLNSEENFFDEIIPLPHPRWIMQYRRKRMAEFVERYMEVLKSLKEKSLNMRN
jgi:uracil-DNA glycosylase